MIKRLFATIPLIALLIGIWRFENIHDWWYLRSYQPSTEIVALADNSVMTADARRAFYLADPQIDPKTDFSTHCPVSELSLVLGCYVDNSFIAGKIYLLRVDRAELANVQEVTAAHEMLHAAYADLSNRERQQVNEWINQFYKTVNDPKVLELVAEYERAEPGQRLNELHSILPTQVQTLSPELDAYYKRYFSNRSHVVAAYKSYEAVFEKIEDQITALRGEIDALKVELDSLEAKIQASRSTLDAIDKELGNFRAQGNIETYNAAVPNQNAQVRQYNSLIAEYRSLVGTYNNKVNRLNQLALEQNQLVDSLDSTKFAPL